MPISIQVENIKCEGCAARIEKKLGHIEGIWEVKVDVDAGLVTCTVDPQAEVEEYDALTHKVKQLMAEMGYPEVGSVEGLRAAKSKAKSYVSCALGKMSDDSSDKD